MEKHKLIAYLIALLNLINGYFQRDYILNFTNSDFKFFERRRYLGIDKYEFSSLINGLDPRLYSMLFFAIVSFLSSVAFIHFYFQNKKYTVITLWIYIVAYFISVLIFAFAFLFKGGLLGFEFFQNIKNSLSSSFFLLFLIALFIYDGKQKSANESN